VVDLLHRYEVCVVLIMLSVLSACTTIRPVPEEGMGIFVNKIAPYDNIEIGHLENRLPEICSGYYRHTSSNGNLDTGEFIGNRISNVLRRYAAGSKWDHPSPNDRSTVWKFDFFGYREKQGQAPSRLSLYLVYRGITGHVALCSDSDCAQNNSCYYFLNR
jgi:hypothetical protein